MGRTAVNVAGQTVVPTIVAKRNGMLQPELYDAERNGDPFADDSVESDTFETDAAELPSQESTSASSATVETANRG